MHAMNLIRTTWVCEQQVNCKGVPPHFAKWSNSSMVEQELGTLHTFGERSCTNAIDGVFLRKKMQEMILCDTFM